MSQQTTLIAVGPLPPPVHGAATTIPSLVEAVHGRCKLVIANVSPGSITQNVWHRTVKFVRVFGAMVALLCHASSKYRCLYICADAGWGTYYTLAIVALARILGYPTFIHHESFLYIERRALRMILLTRCAGRKATHIFGCSIMQRRFCEKYPATRRYVVSSNAYRVTPLTSLPKFSEGPLRLGHLSNLGPEKGLNEVLAVLRRLLGLNISVRLILAGPPVSTDVEAQVEAAKTEFGAALEYRGGVYGSDKDDFYQNLDVFLFPTQYRHEAQPNVLFEAMAFAVPSISYARGCVANDLANGGGVAIPTDEDFVEMALPVLIEWERDRKQLAMAKQNALARAFEHKRESEAQFEEFVTMLTSTA